MVWTLGPVLFLPLLFFWFSDTLFNPFDRPIHAVKISGEERPVAECAGIRPFLTRIDPVS
jgi:hypothetical protein